MRRLELLVIAGGKAIGRRLGVIVVEFEPS